jgi:general secretion pathway protein N
MIRKRWFLPVVGVLAYLIFFIATLPADLVLGRLAKAGVQGAGVEGTLWSGHAAVVQIGSTPVGAVTWKTRALPLLIGHWAGTAKVQRSDGFADGDFSVALSGRTVLNNFSASLPVAALGPALFPSNWSAMLDVHMDALTLVGGWPVDAKGTLEVRDLTGPANQPNQLGSFKGTFPSAAPPLANTLSGDVVDTDSTLQLQGTLKLAMDRSYVFEGQVAARPNAPAGFERTLQMLGPPDGQGKRPFSVAGSM